MVTPTTTPLGYLGVDSPNPRNTFYRRRGPTVNDFRAYTVGDRWIDTVTSNAYILTSKSSSIANWALLATSGGDIAQVTTSAGIAIPVLGNINLLGSNGNTTSAAVNTITINNKRWLSPYVVDAVGANGEYTTIQGAINAAFAAGGGTVYIHPGTYVENLTLQPAVDLFAAVGEARASALPPANLVTIQGSHIFSATGTVSIDDCVLDGNGADILTISAPAGTASLVVLQDCNLLTTGLSLGTIGSAAGGASLLVMVDANAAFSNAGFTMQNSSFILLQDVDVQSSPGPFITNNQTVGTLEVSRSNIDTLAAAGIVIGSATATANIKFSTFRSGGNPAISFTAAGTVTSYHNTYESFDASTNYIDGAVGTYRYADDINTGSAINIAAGISAFPADWKPYGTSGTPATAIHGTAGFDNAHFTVTGGFVQLVGGPAITALSPDNGANVLPTLGVLNLRGITAVVNVPSGIQTHFDSADTMYWEDTRWLSAYVVDPSAVVGQRGTFTTISAAVAAIGAGVGTIYVRPGTYIESPTLAGTIHIIGVQASGDNSSIALSGTLSVAAGSACAIENFLISGQVNCTSGAPLTLTNCILFNGAGDALLVSGGSIIVESCDLQAIGGFSANVSASNPLFQNCSFFSSSSVSGTGSPTFDDCSFGGQLAVSGTASIAVFNSTFSTGALSSISIGVGSSVQANHCTLNSGAASGFPISGTGSLLWADLVFPGSAQVVDPGLTSTKLNWQPYGESGILATAYRGTSAFASTQFTVTDGFVQLFSPPFAWNTTAISIANLTVNNGYFAIAPGGALTFGLPAVSVLGDTLRVSLNGATSWQITQAAGQQIIFGATATTLGAGGSLTSTANGDSIEIVCVVANTIWVTQNFIGTITVV